MSDLENFSLIAVQGLSSFCGNFNIKICNFKFREKLQLLTRYTFFRNLHCSSTNLLTVEADRISVMLKTSGVTRTIALNISNVF